MTVNRIDVWVETKRKYRGQPREKSKKYTKVPVIQDKPYYSNSKVYNFKMDIIDAAIFYKKQGYNPLLLNMADWNIPGGSVEFGSIAQEEECFRRSNYFNHLTKDHYPMGKLDVVYSKDVEFYRLGANYQYKILDEPIKLDMIASPSLRHPQLSEDYKKFGNESDILLMTDKIRMLLSVGVENKHDIIVLSSWGCGVYGCPPIHMAKLFRNVIEKEFSNLFEGIVFAIHDEKTYDIYNDVFSL